jgi:hypothetical protein
MMIALIPGVAGSSQKKAGTMLMTKNAQGQNIPMRVHEIKDKTVVSTSISRWREIAQLRVKVTDIKATN